MKKIRKFKIIDHGIDVPSYFPGCGSGSYDDVSTGIGNDAQEAYNNAMDDLALDWNIQNLPVEPENLGTDVVTHKGQHYYVSIRVME